jgi:SnoaL-like domain
MITEVIDMMLPEVLKTYLEAQNDHDTDRLVACFAENAKVRDEGEDIIGHAAIRAWKERVQAKYNLQVEPIRHWQDGEHDALTARVTGTFPGSPVELTYLFGIKDGLITSFRVQ